MPMFRQVRPLLDRMGLRGPGLLDAVIDTRPLMHATVILPLLAFGTGAADAFAFTALGGIFTANMTGNAVLATIYTRADYWWTLAGAVTGIAGFGAGLFIGFRATVPTTTAFRSSRMLIALGMSAVCLKLVALLWWFAPHSRDALLGMIAFSAAAMALQTVAAKRDGVARGATTTYATGTLTDLMQDIAEGAVPWRNVRWLALAALPFGALVAVLTGTVWPEATPLLPLAATLLAMVLVAGR